jgi:hypothetical protein
MVKRCPYCGQLGGHAWHCKRPGGPSASEHPASETPVKLSSPKASPPPISRPPTVIAVKQESVTRTQRICIVIGMAILVAMWLFPPWLDHGYSYGYEFGGYSFLFYSEHDRVDFGRLIAQSVVVGVLTIIAFLAFRSSALGSGKRNDVTAPAPPETPIVQPPSPTKQPVRIGWIILWVLTGMALLLGCLGIGVDKYKFAGTAIAFVIFNLVVGIVTRARAFYAKQPPASRQRVGVVGAVVIGVVLVILMVVFINARSRYGRDQNSSTPIPLQALGETLPPKPDRYFNDYVGVISNEAAQRFNAQLAQFERETSNQVVVAVFPKMQSDSDIADYTQRVAQAWGVGQKERRNGVVLFVFIQDRKMFIQVGYGLEGALPNVAAFDITERHIKPLFRAGNYEAGLGTGIDLICKATRWEYKGSGKTVAEQHSGAGPPAPTAPAVAEPPTWEKIKATPEYQQLDPNQQLAAFQHWHDAVLSYASTLQGDNDVLHQEFQGNIVKERRALESAAQRYNEQHSAVHNPR